MHDQRKAVLDNSAEDRQDERAVLSHVVETFPVTLRLSDLIRELAASEDFADRDRIERAVKSLVSVGLLFRCDGGTVLPTRQTAHAYQLFNE
jgi:hypothetical protein